jgi:hypothetical protein
MFSVYQTLYNIYQIKIVCPASLQNAPFNVVLESKTQCFKLFMAVVYESY